MATEKFFVFNESGTLKRLKGRIVRFLDNEDPDNTDKTNIRASISVPASAEGLTPANNLSDVSSVATSRDNLGVPSDDELAEANGTKLLGPSVRFDGVNDVVTIADAASLLHFNDGSDDLPFSVSAWVKINDATGGVIASKFGSVDADKEWYFYLDSSDLLTFSVQSSSGNYETVYATAALTSYEGQWVHLCVTYGGSGANSASSYLNAADEMTIFVNGSSVAVTNNSAGSYAGMPDNAEEFRIGARDSAGYFDGEIRSVQIHNRELTAAEVGELARGNELGFSDQYAGANGGTYTSDFSSTTDSFTTSATSLAQITGPIDGRSNLLRIAGDGASSNHAAIRNVGATIGKRYRITLDYDIQGSNTVVDGVRMRWNNGTEYSSTGTTAGSWGRIEFESIATDASFEIYMMDGAAQVNAAPATDYIYVSSVTVTEIGTLADFRAEDYNQSANKLLDRSTNNFVGVGTGVTLTGKRRHLSAATLDLTNLPTSSAGLSTGEVWSNSGVLTIV